MRVISNSGDFPKKCQMIPAENPPKLHGRPLFEADFHPPGKWHLLEGVSGVHRFQPAGDGTGHHRIQDRGNLRGEIKNKTTALEVLKESLLHQA